MSYCRKEGKDTIIFATKEDHAVPSTVTLPEPERAPGIIMPDGSINWNCPCLGGMATGPCGLEFREAFSCFHHSTAEPKGSDCLQSFSEMHTCMQKYPTLYSSKIGAEDSSEIFEDDGDELDELDKPETSGVIKDAEKRVDQIESEWEKRLEKQADNKESIELKGEKMGTIRSGNSLKS